MISPEQKEFRKTGLFSSDIARIMTGHGVEVALSKLGLLEEDGDFDEAQEFKIGKIAEPLILDAYDSLVGCKVERDIGTVMHSTIPWMGCHQDARRPDFNIEAKTVRKEMRYHWGNGNDEVADYVLWQAIVQMCVTGTLTTDIPVCFLSLANVRSLLAKEQPVITMFQVKKDFELEDYMIKKATHVRDCIEQGITPAPENLSDIKLLYSKATDPAVEATEEMVAYWTELVGTKALLKQAEDKEKDLKFKIQTYMKASEALVLTSNGRTLATWKNDADSLRFNKNKFEVDNPELFKQYLQDQIGPRKFLCKKPK